MGSVVELSVLEVSHLSDLFIACHVHRGYYLYNISSEVCHSLSLSGV